MAVTSRKKKIYIKKTIALNFIIRKFFNIFSLKHTNILKCDAASQKCSYIYFVDKKKGSTTKTNEERKYTFIHHEKALYKLQES